MPDETRPVNMQPVAVTITPILQKNPFIIDKIKVLETAFEKEAY
jgi:hypothetical protein